MFRIRICKKLSIFLIPVLVAFGFACSNSSSRNRPSPPSVTVTTPVGVVSGVVLVDFTLLDSESDPVNIVVEFSIDSGTSFAPADLGGFGTTGLPSNPQGVAYTAPWDSDADGVGAGGPVSTVRIRITPSDSDLGLPDETLDFSVVNLGPNGRPVAILTTPPGVVAATVLIPTTISDPESDPVEITAEFSTDSGVTWQTADLGGFSTTGLATTPAGVAHTVPWDSVSDGIGLAGAVLTTRFRVTPADFPPTLVGAPGDTTDFTVDNSGFFIYVHHLQTGDRNVSVFRVTSGTGALAEVPNSPFDLLVSGNPFGTWDLLSIGDRLVVPFWKSVGEVGVYDVDPTSGMMTEVASSPTGSGVGSQYVRNVAYGGGRVFAVNMQTNEISVFDYDVATGALTLTPNSPFATLGRQGIRIEYGDGRIFSTNTLSDPLTLNPPGIAVLDVDPATGDLTHLPFSPMTFDPPGAILHRNGRLIATRTVGAITEVHVWDVDPVSGVFTAVAGSPFSTTGLGGYNIEFANDFLFVIHDTSGQVGVFQMDPATGGLMEVTGSPFATGGGPWGVAYFRDFLFVTNRFDDTISVFDVDPLTGFLTEVAGSPFPSGGLDTTVVEVPR
ncbi:MAG: beta-propeller fold lactonase family protein [Planctomycetota bacterium]|nr:beta-propeller fold lactonase family protein [Planctomycetota bacterium]